MNPQVRCLITVPLLIATSMAFRPATVSAQDATTAATCNQPMADAVAGVKIKGVPAGLTLTRDGCWIFVKVKVAAADNVNGIAVLRRSGGTIAQVNLLRLKEPVDSDTMELTHDDKMLIVRDGREVVFFDVGRLIAGRDDARLGALSDHHFGPLGGKAITLDDKYLFVGHAFAEWITIINLDEGRRSGFGPSAIVGGIPTDGNPYTLRMSPDGRLLYATGEPVHASPGWIADPPQACATNRNRKMDGVLVIDVQRAIAQPDASSVIAGLRPGCGALSLALSPDSGTLYVVAPQDDELHAFDTLPLQAGRPPVLIGTVPVGSAPRTVVTIDNGKKVVVANANARGGSALSSETSAYLAVIDATRIASGADAVVGSIPAPQTPESMKVTADGRTLLVTDLASSGSRPAKVGPMTFEVIDLDRLTLGPPRPNAPK